MGCMPFLHAEQRVKDCRRYHPVVQYESKSRPQRQNFLYHLLTEHGYSSTSPLGPTYAKLRGP